ncbi:MFS transporter [Colwellia sp. MEBiC06753]
MPILFFTVLIDLIGFGIVIPILPFMAPKLGASYFDIAMIIAVYSICAGLMGSAWGKLSDKIGRKPVILICLIITAISYVLLALSDSLLDVYIARIIAGSAAGIYGVASAMVADLSNPNERAKSMGLIGASFGIGMVAGPALGALLADGENSFFLPAIVAAGLSLAAMIFGVIFLPESHDRNARNAHKAWRKEVGKIKTLTVLKNTNNRWLIIEFLFHSMVVSTVTYLFPLWMGSQLAWGPKEIGIVFAIQGLAMAALQGKFVGVLAKKIGELQVLTLGISLIIIGFALATFAAIESLMVLSFFLTITGSSMCGPITNSQLSQRTPIEYRGRLMGSASAMGAWGRVIGPLLAGWFVTSVGFSLAWAFGILIGLAFISWPVHQLTRVHVNAETAAD